MAENLQMIQELDVSPKKIRAKKAISGLLSVIGENRRMNTG